MTRRRNQDPHAAREAARYASPVASREHILETLQREGRPLDLATLARAP